MLENHKTIREAIASFYVSFGTCITFSQTNKYGAVQFPQIANNGYQQLVNTCYNISTAGGLHSLAD